MKFVISGIVYLSCLLGQSSGIITGYVTDSQTLQPLAGANIIIEGTMLGTAADSFGRFRLEDVPVGSSTLRVDMIGYAPVIRPNVHVSGVHQTQLTFELVSQAIDSEGVTVTSGYFESSSDAVISSRTVNIEEIRSDPVGGYDVQRMMQALPSVVSGSDQENEIIVRGGGPGENLFVMDHLEIPNPNHFGWETSGGGPINMLNTDFIERIDFYAGGFPAKYGDKMSSVMDITLREGNRDKFETKLDMNMAGLGIICEGPFSMGEGSYLVSLRQSYLKYVIKNTGLTAIPEYWNGQVKVVKDLNARNKIVVNAIGGQDYIKLEDEDTPQNRGADNVISDGYQYTTGITWKSLFSEKGYSLISLGHTKTNWNYDVYSLIDGIKDSYALKDDTESDTFFKNDLIYRFSPELIVSTGMNIKYGHYDHNSVIEESRINHYFYNDPILDDFTIIDEEVYYQWLDEHPDTEPDICTYCPPTILPQYMQNRTGHLWKSAAYFQVNYNILKKLSLHAGFRYDSVPYNRTSVVNPRVGLSWHLTNLTQINLAGGRYIQTPSYALLLWDKNEERLKNPRDEQIILGLDHLFAEDTKGSLEIYYKSYFDKPVEKSQITGDFISEGYVSQGNGRAYGLEVFLQKKFADRWYGTFSYSYSVAQGVDPRVTNKKKYYDWNYDYRNVLTMIGGYKFKFIENVWYQKIRERAWFTFTNWLPFFPADEVEASFRYRYAGGRPYTAEIYDYHIREWVTIPDPAYTNSEMIEWNTLRFDYYSRFDIMILRRFNFHSVSVTTFFDLQNVFNRDNPWDYVRYDNGKKEIALQYKQMPVGGVIIEF